MRSERKRIPQSEFPKCFDSWFELTQKCIDLNGEYFVNNRAIFRDTYLLLFLIQKHLAHFLSGESIIDRQINEIWFDMDENLESSDA